VLRIPADHKLPVITFGSSDSLRVGDVVLAIGNPFGVGQTVTIRHRLGAGPQPAGHQHLRELHPDRRRDQPGQLGRRAGRCQGNLVGINTAIYSQSGGSMGIGFAIPVSLAKSVMEQIVRTGGVTRGWVGIEVQEITPELAESFKLPDTRGALIAGVMRGSPADKAGIKPGDVLTQVAGKPVKDAQVMLELIAALEPGTTARFELKREGRDVASTSPSASARARRRNKPYRNEAFSASSALLPGQR
jgi:S1-C subfamily serine protease